MGSVLSAAADLGDPVVLGGPGVARGEPAEGVALLAAPALALAPLAELAVLRVALAGLAVARAVQVDPAGLAALGVT